MREEEAANLAQMMADAEAAAELERKEEEEALARRQRLAKEKFTSSERRRAEKDRAERAAAEEEAQQRRSEVEKRRERELEKMRVRAKEVSEKVSSCATFASHCCQGKLTLTLECFSRRLFSSANSYVWKKSPFARIGSVVRISVRSSVDRRRALGRRRAPWRLWT